MIKARVYNHINHVPREWNFLGQRLRTLGVILILTAAIITTLTLYTAGTMAGIVTGACLILTILFANSRINKLASLDDSGLRSDTKEYTLIKLATRYITKPYYTNSLNDLHANKK